MKNILPLAALALMISLSSCNGIMSGIYDEPDAEAEPGIGFTQLCSPSDPGTIYIDASSYTEWTYISFAQNRTITLDIDAEEPDNWDIAIHRYDAKTNGGCVLETSSEDFPTAISSFTDDDEGFTPDIFTTETIVTDMSTMMDGYLSYTDSFYNPVLSKWLDVDKSSMPPTYTLSDKVYIIKLANGKRCAIKLKDFMNESGIKGYMTLQYIYPI